MIDNERIVGVCNQFGRYALWAMSLSVFRSWFVVCGCTCSSCHIVMVGNYICSIRHCGALMTWPDQWSVTIVLLVGGWTSVVTVVFCWVRVTAVGLQTTACLGVVGATDGCTVGAVGVCCSCTASKVDGVVTFTNVVSCSSVLSSTNDFDDVWAMIGCMYYSHCLLQKQTVLHRVGLFCGNFYGDG